MSAAPYDLRGKLALITGATSGIGLASARAFAGLGANLVLTGRRETRLRELAAELTATHGIRAEAVAFDISDRAACEAAVRSNAARFREVDVLLNNAGLARGVDPLHTGSLDDFDAMIDTNVKGLLYLTRPIAAAMAERDSGHVVNLGSVAGHWVYPGGAVYCATKFAVRALTEGLRLDLKGTRVRVTNVEPGMVETEFSDVRLGDAQKAKKVYEGMQPLSPDDVADAIVWCATRPLHVNVQELMLFPVDQPGVGHVVRRDPMSRRDGN